MGKEMEFWAVGHQRPRQTDDDVEAHLAFVTTSKPSNRPKPGSQDLAWSLPGLKFPFSYGGRVGLFPTPENDLKGSWDEIETASSKASLQHKRRRYLINASPILLWLLVVSFYLVDVNRSWRALEEQWTTHAGVPADNESVKANVTRLWGHSHNDEMHGKDAFNVALGLGFGSIEADTWLIDHDGSPNLMVGHVPVDLSRHRTLQSIYLDPIYRILERRNKGRMPNQTWVGLLEDDPTAEVQLVIDFKSGGAAMWPYVLNALEPLLTAGYLTTYDTTTSTFFHGPVTIIGTGNTPLSHVYYFSPRVIFYDAPLRKLHKPARIPNSPYGPAIRVELDHTISPMASAEIPPWTHIGAALYPTRNAAIQWMRRRTDEARKRGIRSRWWGAANQPAWLRRRMWALQKEAGTDWINGDDLVDLARWLRRTGGDRL